MGILYKRVYIFQSAIGIEPVMALKSFLGTLCLLRSSVKVTWCSGIGLYSKNSSKVTHLSAFVRLNHA